MFLEEVLDRSPILSEAPTPGTALLPPPGLEPPQGMPSHGSLLHFHGSCRPCGWFWKASGCQNGRDCMHCHLCPQGAAKQRKKVKQVVARRDHLLAEQPEAAFRPVWSSASTSTATSDHEVVPAGLDSEHDLQSASEVENDCADDLVDLDAERAGVEHTNPGSLLHEAGQCVPCAWWWKPSGCSRGDGCGFCHLCPSIEIKARKKTKHSVLREARLARHAARGQARPCRV